MEVEKMSSASQAETEVMKNSVRKAADYNSLDQVSVQKTEDQAEPNAGSLRLLDGNEKKYQSTMARKAVENANHRAAQMGTVAKFKYDDDINRITITIEDRESNKIIKEIPSEETQKVLERIHTMCGMLMDEEV